MCYVDDILFYTCHDEDIDAIISLLKKDGIMIRKEGSAEGFLGVNVKLLGAPGAPHLLLTQAGPTKRIIEALGLCSSKTTVISSRPKLRLFLRISQNWL